MSGSERVTGPDGLVALGLVAGQQARFRRTPGDRWKQGRLRAVEADGSLGITDDRGAARAIPIDQVEVRVPGRGRSMRWEPAAEVAGRTEQLKLI